MIAVRATLNYLLIIMGTFIAACQSEQTCQLPDKQYRVLLYRTPQQSFLFEKGLKENPIEFSIRGDGDFDRDIEHVFNKHIGRDVGVEALVCGRIEDVDLPLTEFNTAIAIKSGKVIAEVDMTEMIKGYHTSIHMPDFSDTNAVPAVGNPLPSSSQGRAGEIGQ